MTTSPVVVPLFVHKGVVGVDYVNPFYILRSLSLSYPNLEMRSRKITYSNPSDTFDRLDFKGQIVIIYGVLYLYLYLKKK